MVVDFGACASMRDDRRIVVSENGRSFVLCNEKRVEVIVVHVDGCWVTAGERCDYLMVVAEHARWLFIELKGSDIAKAFKQLEETYCAARKHFGGAVRGEGYIVASRVPMPTQVQKLKVAMLRQWGVVVTVKNRSVEVNA